MSAMPSPYTIRREVDRLSATINDRLIQSREAGIAEGKRLSRAWLARHGGALIAFGVCVGITLAVVLLPMIGFIFGVNA